ncbi:hypothetical protein F5Y16DRAFT_403904 [Xylariaceae sp. FL0255]|nr:hypothetical protein F5Y16DRAFT_403904 [Xylariaceae sp. FL0255]
MGPYPQCGTCYNVFPAGGRARSNHLRSTGHRMPQYECESCYLVGDDQYDWHSHMMRANHFARRCEFCSQTFPSDAKRTEHEQQTHHWCGECQRQFNNDNNLRMHLNSRIHRNHELPCPFGKKQHNTATGLAYHIESGSCPNAKGISRDTLYKVVRSKDPSGIITNNLIGWHGSTRYEANHLAYNYSCAAWECYLCHRLFGSLPALNQHLQSPAHQQKYYHCPNRSCNTEFTTITGFFNHLESESCGYARFENVQNTIQGVVSGDRLIAF